MPQDFIPQAQEAALVWCMWQSCWKPILNPWIKNNNKKNFKMSLLCCCAAAPGGFWLALPAEMLEKAAMEKGNFAACGLWLCRDGRTCWVLGRRDGDSSRTLGTPFCFPLSPCRFDYSSFVSPQLCDNHWNHIYPSLLHDLWFPKKNFFGRSSSDPPLQLLKMSCGQQFL